MSATVPACFAIDGERVAEELRGACEKLDSASGEVVLDFSSVHRIDTGALMGMEKLARAAEGKNVRVALRGLTVENYKVLKLARLASRFSFAD